MKYILGIAMLISFGKAIMYEYYGHNVVTVQQSALAMLNCIFLALLWIGIMLHGRFCNTEKIVFTLKRPDRDDEDDD